MLDIGAEPVQAGEKPDQDQQQCRPAGETPGQGDGTAKPEPLGDVRTAAERPDHQDPQRQGHHHDRGEREAERDEPLRQGRSPVLDPVGSVQRVAGGGEQVAGQPPGQDQTAERDATALLAELRSHERRDDLVGKPRAHQHPQGGDGLVLSARDPLRPNESLEEAEGGADRHRRRHQRQQGEERHLGGMAREPMVDRGPHRVDGHLPRVVPANSLPSSACPRQGTLNQGAMPARLRTYQPPASHDNIVNLSTRAAGVELLCTMPLPFLPVVDPLAQPDWLDTSEEGRIDDPPTAARSGVDSHKDSHVAVLLDRRLDRWAGSAASTLRAGVGWSWWTCTRVRQVDRLDPLTPGCPMPTWAAVLRPPWVLRRPGRPISVRPPPCSGCTRWVRWSPLWPGPGCAWTGWSSTCRPRSTIVGACSYGDGRPLASDGGRPGRARPVGLGGSKAAA
jgi:hypothetical protein